MVANKYAHTLIILVAFFAVGGAVAAANNFKAAIADYTRPLSFEPNQGQTDKQIDFLSRGSAYRLFLAHGEATLALKNGIAVRMRLAGAAVSSLPEALDPQPSKSNYFLGNVPERWHTNVPNYAKVRYRNVYPGIDLIYYGNQRQLEYDLVVAPGVDPRKIALQFEGAAKTDLESSGDLVMHTEAGELRWHKPIAYQEVNGSRKLVACDYVRKGERLAFRVGAYDRGKPLIIDPELVYSTYLGGSGPKYTDVSVGDSGNAIAVDTKGNAYVTGGTASRDFPVRNAFQGWLEGVEAVFVSKFDSTGKLIYSTYLGGSSTALTSGDAGLGIAVDSEGNAYVTGYTLSPKFPTKNAFQSSRKTEGRSAFVTKLSASGCTLIYSTYLSGSVYDTIGNAIAADSHSNAYITGSTAASDFPTKNAFQGFLKEFGGATNAFVTKFDASGSALVYSTYLGGTGAGTGSTDVGDKGYGIAVDADGNAYVTGVTGSTDFPTKNAFQSHNNAKCFNCSNAFITKFDAAGTELVYSTYLGGSGKNTLGRIPPFGDTASALALDASGNAYVTGAAASSDFPLKNPYQAQNKSCDPFCTNAFVTKLDAAGTALVYSTYLGGSESDFGTSIAVDKNLNAYVAGRTVSADFPTRNGFQHTQAGGFVTKFDSAGTALVYSSYLGGSVIGGAVSVPGDQANGIAVDALGNAYVTGVTYSSNFPTKNPFQNTLKDHNGSAFVTKISAQ